jgi:hypothetical protein
MGGLVTIYGKQGRRAAILLGLLALGASSGACHPYNSDVARLCDSEQASATSLKGNRAQLFNWMGRHVASTPGITLVKELEGKGLHGIADGLREAARGAGLPSCALAEQAEMLAKDEDYQNDLTNLCTGNAAKDDGSVARLDIVEADDAERMREIVEWTRANAKSRETAPFVAKLAAAAPKQRGTMLRAESGRVGIAGCLMGSTLDSQPPPPLVALPTIAPNFAVIKVTGPSANQTALAEAITTRDSAAAINSCYAIALVSTPTLSGKVTTDLSFEATGHHVTKATDDSSQLKGTILTCVQAAYVAMVIHEGLPEHPKKGSLKAGVTLLFSSSPAPGFNASIDPAVVGKSAKKHK